MRMIVGLGNPGEDYEDTPHNIGFAVVKELARRFGVDLRRGPKPKMESARISGESPFVLLRPMAYMNLSGQPVLEALKWYSLKPDNLLIICDDVNLPLGRLRFRTEGGAGGQKGLVSIIASLGTQAFSRLRLGVGGGAPGADVAAHVLTKFRGVRKEQAERIISKAADAAECWLREGIDAAMNTYNQQEE
ncbi:aminoacyl-tRNA hydrolase [bacterium]|nr:aminoacyl-tRNA hydrolase [bacterium]